MNARKDVARAALALEACIPGLEISEVNYEGAANDLAEESRLAAHPRVFEDARGNLLAVDDNGHEYPIGGKALDLEVRFSNSLSLRLIFRPPLPTPTTCQSSSPRRAWMCQRCQSMSLSQSTDCRARNSDIYSSVRHRHSCTGRMTLVRSRKCFGK